MPIATTLLTSGYNLTPGTSFVSAVIAPASNALITLRGNNEKFPGPPSNPSSITGNGLTWVQVLGLNWGNTYEQLNVWRAMGSSPSSGAVTVNFPSSQDAFGWIIEQHTNVDTSGTNGSGAVVQSASNLASTGTSLAVTLATFSDATNNVASGCFCINREEAIGPEGGYTELAEVQYATFALTLESECKTGQDTSVSASWTTSSYSGGIALEIKAASAGVLYTQLERGIRGMNRGMNTGGYR